MSQPDEEEDGNVDLDAQRKGKAVVLKTSTRQVRLALLFSPLTSVASTRV